ncbi:MAG: LytTR family DNA-binding domain-containing protein [Prevotella sp.]|nr:LytTR family DNA-binding domain-containing protein [Prevotella sp.]
MIRCIAIDDEPLALRQLVTYISKVPFLEVAAECHSALEARQFLNEDSADAIFCDINMPDLNGMDFVKSLQAPPLIVFTTAYAEYAVEGFKVDAVDYLLKPFGLDDFKRAANRLKERMEGRNAAEGANGTEAPSQPAAAPQYEPAAAEADDTLFVKTEYRVVKISISNIRYIEGMSEYLKIHLKDQPKPLITLLAMKKLEERLPDYFMRIHRSYIINLKEIQEVNKNRVIMDKDTYLPIGDSYKEAFNDYLNQKFLGK